MIIGGIIRIWKGCIVIEFDTNKFDTREQKIFKEYLEKVPIKYQDCRNLRDNSDQVYHITLVTSQEYKSLNNTDKIKFEQELNLSISKNKFVILGLGVCSDSYYLVCSSLNNCVDKLRKDVGLGEKDFHITLGFNGTDVHEGIKNITTIIYSNYEECDIVSAFLETIGLEYFEKNLIGLRHLNHKFPHNSNILKYLTNELTKCAKWTEAYEYAKLMFELFPNDLNGYYLVLAISQKMSIFDMELLKSIKSCIILCENSSSDKKIICKIIKILNDTCIKYKIETGTKLDCLGELVGYSYHTNHFELIKFIGLLTNFGESNLNELFERVVEENISGKDYVDNFVQRLNNLVINVCNNPNKNIKVFVRDYENEKTNNMTYVFSELPANFSEVEVFDNKVFDNKVFDNIGMDDEDAENVVRFDFLNKKQKLKSKLYGSGIVMPNHIAGIKALGINTIINLIGETRISDEIIKLCEQNDIKLYWKGFTDRTACEMELFEEIIEIIKKPENVCLVHCLGGIGRTNMILGGFVMLNQLVPPSNAIAILKMKRKVIMCPEQIFFLKKYYQVINEQQDNASICTQNKAHNHTSIPAQIQGLLLFVGLPCSGKSTLAMKIFTAFDNSHNKILHLNQDEIGKDNCENILSKNAKTSNLIILDRCNPTKLDRQYWIQMYKGLVGTSKKVHVIFLNLGLELSLARLKTRQNHLTLSNGITGDKIIEQMSKKITIPTKDEGWDDLIQINNLEELERFEISIGLGIKDKDKNKDEDKDSINLNQIIKFPRTKHIVNLGAMARDDLLMSSIDIEHMLKGIVVVEEKIDGANLGFRYDSNKKIIAQNRSHYVCSSSHPQFKKLDQWISMHKTGLDSILSKGNLIIYGEWLYSKHSINYTMLPDYFIMFDIYDIDAKKFYSRERVEKMVIGTGLNMVPIIFKGKTNLEKLKLLAQTNSQYYNGVVEGVYVRLCNSDWLELRAKIVRADFISGDEHWTKGKQVQNMLKI